MQTASSYFNVNLYLDWNSVFMNMLAIGAHIHSNSATQNHYIDRNFPVRIGSRNLISAASTFKFVHVSQNKNSCMNGLSTIRWSVKFAQLFTRTHRYGRSAIRMLFCKISEHILDEILISGKVQIIVSADYFMFGRNRLSKYIQHWH